MSANQLGTVNHYTTGFIRTITVPARFVGEQGYSVSYEDANRGEIWVWVPRAADPQLGQPIQVWTDFGGRVRRVDIGPATVLNRDA